MSIFNFFKPNQPKSAETAKERLQILLAHERTHRQSPDYLPMMQKEIIAVIAKYMEIDEDKVSVKVDKTGDTSMLELNIELPQQPKKSRKRASAAAPA